MDKKEHTTEETMDNKSGGHDGMGKGWLDYIECDIKRRTIPNIEDGLTPVQRIIFHVLFEFESMRKTSRVIRRCMEYFYHSNIYLDSDITSALLELVRKEWFIEGMGNFGEIYYDAPPAHPDYCECEANSFGWAVFHNPELTCYIESIYGKDKIPAFFPAKIPAILLNGTESADTEMSARILPHNLDEIINAEIACLSGKEFNLYPDFPSGGLVDVSRYQDGNGEVLVRAKLKVSDPEHIVIYEIPYGATIWSIIDSITKASQKGQIKIQNISDETERDRIRIVLELYRGVSAKKTVESLFAFTECQKSISTRLVVIKDGVPTVMTVTDIIKYHTGQLVNILSKELEVRRKKLLEIERLNTLKKLFFKNNILKKYEKLKNSEIDFFEFAIDILDPLMKKAGFHGVNDDDVQQLLYIPLHEAHAIYSPFGEYRTDFSKRNKERIATITENIENITDYTINFLHDLKRFSRKRRTKVRKFVVAEYDRNTFAEEEPQIPDTYLAAVKQDVGALKYVPTKYKTSDLCLAAVQKNGYALKYVPDELKTPELCLAAIQNYDLFTGSALEYIPDELKTPELCLMAVQKNGYALEYVPAKYKTPDLCLAAVQQYGDALKYVPDELKTEELCLEAVKQDGHALYDVPEGLQTKEVCITAIKNNGDFEYVPNELRTEEFYLAAVQQCGLVHVPNRLKTERLCLAAVKKNGQALKHVPEKLQTEELCLTAVLQDKSALVFVPKKLRAKIRKTLKES
ncbi:MAG: DUF4116 domain-containing protein [Treponema sp.]|nr:DUF4116 domain-containing protein [Treponema sp.]